MSDIVRSMEKKGYRALYADRTAGIGFKPSLTKQCGALTKPVWFDTGLKMNGIDESGKTVKVARLVCAYDGVQHAEYIAKGWKVIDNVSAISKGEADENEQERGRGEGGCQDVQASAEGNGKASKRCGGKVDGAARKKSGRTGRAKKG